MKNAFRPLLLLSHIALLCSTTAAYAQSETLLDIYALAKANDHQLKSDYAEYLANRESAAIARGSLGPEIVGSGSFTNTHAESGSLSSDTDETSYTIALTQPLIDFSVWNTYKQGKAQTRVAEVTYEADKQSLIIRSAQAYFDTLREVDQLQTDIAEEKAQATLLEQTRQRYEVGLISINDVHETQAAYDNAVANRINTEANVGIQYDALTVLTGKLHRSIAPLKKDFTAVAPEPKNQQAWVDFALANNFELKASELTAEVNRLSAKSSKSDLLPTVEGSISYTDRSRSSGSITNTTSFNDTQSTVIGISLSIPLYAGGTLLAQHRQAAQNAVAARENFLFTQRNTIQNTRSLYLSVTTDIAQIRARKQAIISNESALEATRAGYDAGTRDIVDVVDAQSNLFQAQRDYLDTLYNYIINTLLLKQAAGTLQVSDLEGLEKSLTQHALQ